MPKSFKILFIGFDSLPLTGSDEYFKSWPIYTDSDNFVFVDEKDGDKINLFDYHIVIINDRKDYPQAITTNLNSFVTDGGVACIFVTKNNIHLLKSYFIAKPTELGTSITTLDKKNWLARIITNSTYKFQWSAILDKGQQYANLEMYQALASMQAFYGKKYIGLPSQYKEIAFAPNNKCVCAIANINNGKIVALPYPCLMNKELLRNLLDSIRKEYYDDTTKVDTPPIWVDTILLPSETEKTERLFKLRSELETHTEEYINYTKYKKILYTTGIELSKGVFDILSCMGFTCDYTERGGQHDIEIKGNNIAGIIEVKGLMGYANVDDVRQLLDWYIDTIKTDKCVKGIFIVNHFRTNEPATRKEPYTQSAVDLATNNKFCLMTTFDLFNLYCDYLTSKIDLNSICELINNTSGLFNRQK